MFGWWSRWNQGEEQKGGGARRCCPSPRPGFVRAPVFIPREAGAWESIRVFSRRRRLRFDEFFSPRRPGVTAATGVQLLSRRFLPVSARLLRTQHFQMAERPPCTLAQHLQSATAAGPRRLCLRRKHLEFLLKRNSI